MAKSTKTKDPVNEQDKFMLRLPAGMRERIKEYADKHGRSMNGEIVRVLEREFPEPWPIETRLTNLLILTEALRNTGDEKIVDQLGNELRETLRGIAMGRVPGFPDETRSGVAGWLESWEEDLQNEWAEEYKSRLDPEEAENFEISGRTAKPPKKGD